MIDPASADIPVAIDRVDRARGEGDGIRLRLSGRWLASGGPGEQEPLLVVQLHGRRHRFAPTREGGEDPAEPGVWRATFVLPSWAEPQQDGQAALWVGNAVVPIPLPGARVSELGPPARPPTPDAPSAYESAVETGRAGPLAELLFKESVSALHAELEQRSREVARLRGSLADAESELEARTAKQTALESAHGQLRDELQQLISAVAEQRQEFEQRVSGTEERLAAVESERDRLQSELDSERSRAREQLESERSRVREELNAERAQARADVEAERARSAQQLSELTAEREAEAGETAVLRQQLAAAAADQQRQAADVGALREELASANVSRGAATSEVAGLRAELERIGSELAVTRELHSADGGNLGEAQQLLADARALTEQLRGGSAG
jgi:hypothetical protein